ncbi:hypothetical protein P4O66_019662 [Electrophorus voltai]|uniref:Uncharacterized protein n=1 Tax=Electrophorus voltai TaxID=2609070 RepID=A0AAD9E516_9TELE|nr:hypothetical protein P4O66_019662 [Electrophorus voltai]
MPSSKASFSHLTKRSAIPGGGSGRNMSKDYSLNLSVQQVLSLWVKGTIPTLQHFTGMFQQPGPPIKSCNRDHIVPSIIGEQDACVRVCDRDWECVMLVLPDPSEYPRALGELHQGIVGVPQCIVGLITGLSVHLDYSASSPVKETLGWRGRLITVVIVSVGFLASLTGSVITSAAVAGVYRVAGKDMAPLEALVFGVGQTTLTVLISFSRILATL